VPTGTGADYDYYTHNYTYYREGEKKPRRRTDSAAKDDPPRDRLDLREPGPPDRTA
jgi:hypothetical protein